MPWKWFHLLLSALCWTKQSPPSFTLPSQLRFPSSLVVFDHSEEIYVSSLLYWQRMATLRMSIGPEAAALGCSTRGLARRPSLSSACAEHMRLSHSLKFLLWGRSSVKRMLLIYHDIYSCRGIQAIWTTSYSIALLGLLLLSNGLSLHRVSAVAFSGVCMGSSVFAHVAPSPAALWVVAGRLPSWGEMALFLQLIYLFIFLWGDDNVGGFFCLEFM